MTIQEVAKLVAEVKAACPLKYPHGAFVNPSTICQLITFHKAPRGSAERRAFMDFSALEVFPLEAVPKGEIWPRAKDGTIDFDSYFLAQAGIAGTLA